MPSKKRKGANRWELRRVRLSEVVPSERNPRSISDANMASLSASLRRFGYVDPIVWNERTGNIVGGHQRFRILSESGVEDAVMVVVDLDDGEEQAANLTLNNPEIEGEWDDPIGELLGHLEGLDPDFFKEAGFDELKKAVERMEPRTGDDSYQDKNQEIDIDELTSGCDTKCPCCSFEWEIDDKDVGVMTEEQQREVRNG